MFKPLFVRQNRKGKRIDPLEVFVIYTERNYTKLYMKEGNKYMIRSSLTAAMEKFPKGTFIQVSRSCAVCVYHIQEVTKDCMLVGDYEVPIARQFFDNVLEHIEIIG